MSSEFINSKGVKAIDVQHLQHEERFWDEFTMSKQQKIHINKSPNNMQNWKIRMKQKEFKTWIENLNRPYLMFDGA